MQHSPSKAGKNGFTLVEVMVAGAILAMLTCALLEGIIVAVKVSRDNSRHLAAEALAFDLAWLHFNRDYDSDLRKATLAGSSTTTYNNAGTLAPTLADANASAQVRISSVNGISGVLIHSEVSWGPSANRQTVAHDVFRGSMSRTTGN